MNFLMKMENRMEEKRKKDVEESAEIRKRERAEDREEMAKLIDSKLGEKVVEAIAPYKDKVDKVEQVQTEMKEQMGILMEQMKSVKQNPSNVPKLLESRPSTMAEIVVSDEHRQDRVTHQTTEADLRSIISLSRRTVGLQKIDQNDLMRMRQEQYGGAKTEEEEMNLAVQEFLRLELKLAKTTLENMKIERIFTPVGRENPEWLYVTFSHESSVQKIFDKTRIMRKESRILTYIPKEFHARFEAIRDIGNTLRLEEQCKTRIKMGHMGLQLHRKDKDSGRWRPVQLPAGLPPIELGISPRKPDSGSPAPGRPEQGRVEKRNRDSTGSSGNNTPKVARIENGADLENKEVENADNVEVDMTGKVVAEESYCPATPAPVRPSPAFIYNSPIFSKNKANPTRRQSMII